MEDKNPVTVDPEAVNEASRAPKDKTKADKKPLFGRRTKPKTSATRKQKVEPRVVVLPDRVDTADDGKKQSHVERMDEQVSKNRTDTEYESDKGYREITEKIIEISDEYLRNQHECKKPLRKCFFWLFAILLCVQYAFLVVCIVLNACTNVPFAITEEILRLYIISVFIETLTAMGVMIAFAFASGDETEIVGVLNNIVENYQKVKLDKSDEQPKKDGEK